MRIFTNKLATYLSTGDVAGLQNALFRGSCRVSTVCSGIPRSYRVTQVHLDRIGLRLGLVLVFYCMSPVYVCVCVCVDASFAAFTFNLYPFCCHTVTLAKLFHVITILCSP